jgi:hypothetical protein
VGSAESLARCRRTLGIVVVLPQEAVATESSSVMSGTDVVVDAGGMTRCSRHRWSLTLVLPCAAQRGAKAYLRKIFAQGMDKGVILVFCVQ